MAASTGYSELYNSSTGKPKAGRPKSSNIGPTIDYVEYTIPTTQIDDATDTSYLIPVRSGKRVVQIVFSADDLAASNLDLDIIGRVTNAAGTHADTILFNAGTAFTSAQSGVVVFPNWLVPSATSESQVGHICLYCNVAGGTPAQGVIKILVVLI